MSSIQDKAIEYIKLVTEKKDAQDAQAYLNQFSEKERIDILVSVKWILAYAQYRSSDKDMSGACYKCKYRGNIPGDHHSCCQKSGAIAFGDPHGVRNGWFLHPFNFDPIWLRFCDSFEEESEEKS